jgi:hypothetical protein
MKSMYAFLSGIALLVCLAAPFAFFWGRIANDEYKMYLLLGSLAWFLFATLYATKNPA